MVRRCPWLGSPRHSTLYLHWTVSGESGGEARKKDRPVSRNRKARFLRGGQVKRERWPLSGRQCTHVRRGTIPSLRAIEAEEGSDGDFGTLPFLNCPIPFPGRENDASPFSSRGQKLEGTISLLVLGGNAKCARAYTHERVERRRERKRRQGWAAAHRQFSPSFSRRFAMETARRGSVITARTARAFDCARTTEARSRLKAAVATSRISREIGI